MNIQNIVTPQIINYCKQFSSIVIVGFPKTLKSTIAEYLSEQINYPLFIADNYINYYDKTKQLNDLRDAILPHYNRNLPFIVEGVLSFRLLRKGIQLNDFFPELIIKTNCNQSIIEYFYKKDGQEDKIKHVLKFNKGLSTIWDEYLSLLSQNPRIKKPKYIELDIIL